MRSSEARPGRVFVVRLEHGDIVHECVERLASDKGILAASVILVGGADKGSALVVGPEKGSALPVRPMRHVLDEAHEVAGAGTIFPDESGKPVLHMHLAAGRKDRALAGCVRMGVKVWHVGEVIIQELVGSSAVRRMDPKTGFALLEP